MNKINKLVIQNLEIDKDTFRKIYPSNELIILKINEIIEVLNNTNLMINNKFDKVETDFGIRDKK